ncbi:prepilin peptidase [Candidatus Woesearchaeota archaeon]|nr:prepilin peptidase [Candidatus Woesearchaeota archaeon]
MAYNWLGADSLSPIIAYALSFVALFVGSITDLKTREVPDWVNYGLIVSGIGINLLFSTIYSNPFFIINSIIGLSIFFGIAYIMFYAGQWGGGDSKILMGLGAVIGIDVGLKTPQFLLSFLITALFVGAIYGLFWSIFLAFKNKQKFWKEFKKILSEKSVIKAKKVMLFALVLLLIILFFIRLDYIKILILSLAFLMLTTFYLWIFVKAIEKSAMHKLVEPTKLTEGDWVVNDIFVNKDYICGPKDLGIDKKQIRKLIEFYRQGRVRKILIKEGIPFVPAFFIAFIVAFVFDPLRWLLIF